jgi:isopentenyl-diphosphate Delta-isomerase
LSERKADHLRIAAEPGIEHTDGSGLDGVRLRHRALPERDLADVSLHCDLLGASLGAPLLISAMTGGTAEAGEVNARLAAAAAEHRIALVLGSGRPLLDDPELLATYRPAGGPRPPLLLANLGAAQVRGPGA